jgi:hypothetical protein
MWQTIGVFAELELSLKPQQIDHTQSLIDQRRDSAICGGSVESGRSTLCRAVNA